VSALQEVISRIASKDVKENSVKIDEIKIINDKNDNLS